MPRSSHHQTPHLQPNWLSLGLLTGLLVLGAVTLTASPPPVLAQTNQIAQAATEEAEATFDLELSPEASQAATENLKERLRKIFEEKRSQIQGTIENLTLRKHSQVGQVVRVTEESLTIENPRGMHIVPLSENVTIRRNASLVSIDDVAVDDWAIILGVIDDQDVFQPIRVNVTTQSLRPNDYFAELGSITELNATNLTMQPRGSEDTITITRNRQTAYEDLSGEPLDDDALSTQVQVLVVGYIDPDEDSDQQRVSTTIRVLTTVEPTESDE